MDLLRFEMPYPPSVNHYYLPTSTGVILGLKGKKYRRDVILLLSKYKNLCGDKRLNITINVFPPDKRKRDIDNILKCTLDTLQHAKVFNDDSQIDMLTVIRRENVLGGSLQVWISECS
jgi:crossover junction endodeoxyribonuclease RusA